MQEVDNKISLQYKLARKFRDIQIWLDTYSRNILDEADEILSFKFQLVYTLGNQSMVSGASLRW